MKKTQIRLAKQIKQSVTKISNIRTCTKHNIYFPSHRNKIVDQGVSEVPTELVNVKLGHIVENLRHLKNLPISLGNLNEDYSDYYPDFFAGLSLPRGLFKKIGVLSPVNTLADDLYKKKQKSKYSTSAKPRRPPAVKVIEKRNTFMKLLIQKMGTKKTLAAFVVALVAILILRYTWNAAKAKKKEDDTTRPLLIKGGFKKSQRFERERVPLNQYPLNQYPLNQYPLRNSLPKRIVNLFITKLFNFIGFLFNFIGFLSVTYILLATCIILLNLLTFLFIKFLERLEIILGIPNTPNDNPIHTFQELQEILKKIL